MNPEIQKPTSVRQASSAKRDPILNIQDIPSVILVRISAPALKAIIAQSILAIQLHAPLEPIRMLKETRN